MGGDKGQTQTDVIGPAQRLLGDIRVDQNECAPLGGLNPYNPHFDRIGEQFLQFLIEYAGLHKKSKVLDIGCGTGRMAKPLLKFLEGGSYDGFDINEHFISYCRKTYTKRSANFKLCDVWHGEYNINGKIDAATFSFPYPNNSFSLAFAIALFNHLETNWALRYIDEASRVLIKGGIFFGTFLILNPTSMRYAESKETHPFKFDHKTDESWHEYKDRRLFNVAMPESILRRQFIKSGLSIKEPIRYGEWQRSSAAITGHDVIIAKNGSWM